MSRSPFPFRTTGAMLAAAALFSATGCAGPRVGRTLDARVPRAPETTVTDVRTLGPFYERVETSAGDTRTSWRPLLHTRIEIPQDQARVREILWPLYSDRSRNEHFSWRFLLAFGADFDTTDPQSRSHVWILPFWFHGRSKTGAPYAALFPIGGTIHHFLMVDRIRFFAFPLWMETQKKDIRGRHFLWPVFANIQGDRISRWRVFPLFGAGKKEGEWRRHFILFPIWTYARYDKEPTAGYEWALTPLIGRADRTVESTWYLFPPFFQFTQGRDRNAAQRRILAPWPLVRIEDSRNLHKRHFWPLYATTWTDRSRNTHALWPFFQATSSSFAGQVRKDWSLAPVFHRSTLRPESPRQGGRSLRQPTPTMSYTRLWPLFSRIERDGKSFLRVPDFSVQKRTGVMERNLLHMGTLYIRGAESSPRHIEHDLLWGLIRWGSREQPAPEPQGPTPATDPAP